MTIIDLNDNIFETIKHIDEFGNEYWYAREFMKELGYKEWRKFKNVIEKAQNSCENSNVDSFNHFVHVAKKVE